MDAAAEILRNIIGGAVIALGAAIMLGGAIGLLRFPDFYTRLHGARVSDGAGTVIFLVGLAIVSADGALALRLLLMAALVALLAPVMGHLSANAAHTGGLAPLAGRYTAPRPGAKREPS